MKKISTILLLCAIQAVAQIPSITAVTLDTAATDNTSFRVFVTTAQASWIEVKYGTSSGNYPYNTRTIQGPAVALSVGGLTPGTTYYILATARPNLNNDTSICATPACGAQELTVTTAPGTGAQPPIPPATWALTHPDTSGYTVVPIAVINSVTGECGATQAASSPDGWSVAAGDTLSTILLRIGYGTVLEFDQGAACVVPYQNPSNYQGYTLGGKSMDPRALGDINSQNHRYIVLRTKSLAPGDFPPFGVRITPTWSARLAKMYIQRPASPNSAAGQVFDADNNGPGVHHYWFENLEFAPAPGYSNPVDAVDPLAFQYFFRLGSQYQTVNNAYMVLDRLYMHGWPPPIRQYDAVELGGNFQAMIGCYISQVQTWRMTAWPLYAGALDGTNRTISIPQENYRFQVATPMLGMSGPATVTLSESSDYRGTVLGNLYKDHLEIQYSPGTALISCTNCVATQTSNLATPGDAFPLFSGQIVGGQFTNLIWNANCETCTSRYGMALGVQWTDPKAPGGGPYLIDNNYIDGVGEGFYIDALYSNYGNDDMTYTHNHNIWPKNYFIRDANWVGWRFNVRQHFEIKRGHRFNITGNVFSYSWSYQNSGPGIFLSSRPQYVPQTLDSGITDITVKSNIIRHGRSGIECWGIAPMDNGAGSSDSQVTSRVAITNNLMYDLGRYLYCDTSNCPGFQSPYFAIRPGCQNVTIKNNTGGMMQGDIPAWLYVGGGNVLPSFLDFENNILYLSAGAASGSPSVLWGGILGDWPTPDYTGHDVKPSVNYSINMDASFSAVPNFKSQLDKTFVNIGSTVVQGAYIWKNNIGIGGYIGAAGSMTDMTSAQLLAMSNKMPPGDFYPAGATIKAREKAINFANPAAGDFHITGPSSSNPGGRGVDYDQLNSDGGLVTSVQPLLRASDRARIRYIAPDTRTCYVDFSSDGTNWSRQADTGGARIRSVTLTGLAASGAYEYRILCYFEQINDGVLYTEYTPDQITRGKFETLPVGTGRISLQFEAASVPGAVRMDVTLTPLAGPAVTASCSTSPCAIPAPIGDYSMKTIYVGAANNQLTAGSPVTVAVR